MSLNASRPTPLGDIDKLEVIRRSKPILTTDSTSYLIFEFYYFVKVLEGGFDRTSIPDDTRIRAVEHEIRMMEIAGADCAFQPLGRVLLRGSVVGYITHLGVSITKNIPEYFSEKETLLGGPSFTLPPTRELAEDLASLVRRLHGTGVIHGDIKCSNLLYSHQAQGLRFCDFGSANLSVSKAMVFSWTSQYATPARARGPFGQTPLSKEDDLYAAGITMWEIGAHASASAPFPFHNIKEDYIDDIVMAGFQPNMYLIEDIPTRRLIRVFLDEGSPGPCPTDTRTVTVCVAATIAYADCTSAVPHTYSKTVHRESCEGAEICDVDMVYRPASTFSHAENLHCNKCK